jgi:hypothetical protein
VRTAEVHSTEFPSIEVHVRVQCVICEPEGVRDVVSFRFDAVDRGEGLLA